MRCSFIVKCIELALLPSCNCSVSFSTVLAEDATRRVWFFGFGIETVILPRRHVAASLTSAPRIFTAGRTVVLPSEGPELRCDSAGARAWLVSSFFTTSKVATVAFVWIWRFCDPREFGANLIDGRISARHGFTDIDTRRQIAEWADR